MSDWLRIDEVVPKEGQHVFYYFGLFDEVYAGRYSFYSGDAGQYHVFSSRLGFLSDDVTYWMPNDGSKVYPPKPTIEEKKKDLFFPRFEEG